MSAIPYDDSPAQDRKLEPESDELATPGRPRRRWWGRKTVALAAAILCAAAFYTGVRVEKSQLSPATTTAASTATAGARGGFGGGFAGGAGGGANASIGTVSSVDGSTIYLTDTSGNTVKVKLSSSTKVTKSESVSGTSVRPGDTVVIQGVKASNGTITATSVSDSGASASRGGASSTGTGATG
jgi:hypothetical protein